MTLKSLFTLTFLTFSSSFAMAWDLEKMNDHIDKTNVNVGGVCTGTFIEPTEERLVLTAFHCIESQFRDKEIEEVDEKTGEVRKKIIREKIPLTIYVRKHVNYEEVARTEHLVKIAANDKSNDVAVLQVVDEDFKPEGVAVLAPTDFNYLRGKKIWLVGNPFGEYEGSVVDGVISHSQRSVDFDVNTGKFKLFQYSANTVGGNSGGPIYSDDGQIIGTVTGGYRGSAVQFAVPVNFTREMLKKAKIEFYTKTVN